MSTTTTKLYATEEIGGPGGKSFYHARPTALIKRLRFWWTDDFIRGIEWTLTDGAKGRLGKSEGGHSAVVELGQDRPITELVVFSNRDRCGGVRIKTAAGTYEAGPLAGTPSYLQGGRAAGITGAHGDDIDRLGFVYANEVVGYELKNVRYDLSRLGDLTMLVPKVVARVTYKNPGKTTAQFTFNESATQAKTHSWTSTLSVKVGVKASFKAGVPFVGKGEWEVSLELGFSHSWGESTTESSQFGFAASGPIPPGKKLTVEGLLLTGTIEVDYEGTAVLTYEDGTVETVVDKGKYRGVGAYSSQVEIGEEMDLGGDELKQAKKMVSAKKRTTVLPAAKKGKVPEKVVILG